MTPSSRKSAHTAGEPLTRRDRQRLERLIERERFVARAAEKLRISPATVARAVSGGGLRPCTLRVLLMALDEIEKAMTTATNSAA